MHQTFRWLVTIYIYLYIYFDDKLSWHGRRHMFACLAICVCVFRNLNPVQKISNTVKLNSELKS